MGGLGAKAGHLYLELRMVSSKSSYWSTHEGGSLLGYLLVIPRGTRTDQTNRETWGCPVTMWLWKFYILCVKW